MFLTLTDCQVFLIKPVVTRPIDHFLLGGFLVTWWATAAGLAFARVWVPIKFLIIRISTLKKADDQKNRRNKLDSPSSWLANILCSKSNIGIDVLCKLCSIVCTLQYIHALCLLLYFHLYMNNILYYKTLFKLDFENRLNLIYIACVVYCTP